VPTGHDVGRGAAAAEHPHVTPGVSQPRDDEPPERARATGDENGRCHGSSACLVHHRMAAPSTGPVPVPNHFRWLARPGVTATVCAA
jgi:hypothetical protein